MGSLLAHCAAEGRALSAAGLRVWGPDLLRDGRLAGLGGGRGKGRLAGRVRLRLAGEEGRRLAVCSPDLLGPLLAQLERARLAPEACARLDRLADAFGPVCDRIVIAVRDWRAYWTSALLWGMALGRPAPGPAMLERLVTQPRSWRRLTVEVAARFPEAEVLILPFERFAARPDAALALMARELRLPPARGRRPHLGTGPRGEALERLTGSARPWRPFGPDQEEALAALYESDLAWFRGGGAVLAGEAILPSARGGSARQGDERWARRDGSRERRAS